MKITIIGTGYVGLVNGACFAEMGNEVTCIDIDKRKIDCLNDGIIPIYEPGLEEMVARNVYANRLFFRNDFNSIKDSEITFIAVGTPPEEDGSADLKYVLSAARAFGENVDVNKFSVIVTKSTVPVGTSKKVYEEAASAINNRGGKINFGVASNPEFLKEGCAINDCLYPDRIVVGVSDEQTKKIMERLYKPFTIIKNKIIFTDIASAEMIKYASNSMLATRISFMNEIASLCELVGANVDDVRKGIGSDTRIGDKFLYPGCGYGGSCFPKDVRALIKTAEEYGLKMKIINATETVNEEQKHILFKKLKNSKNYNNIKTVGILGIAFKPDTDDIREAPSIVLIKELVEANIKVKAYDPIVMSLPKNVIDSDLVLYKDNVYDTIKDVDALVLVTEWKEFRNLHWSEIKDIMTGNTIVDGRNIFDKKELEELGFEYFKIG
jgi:UDPglucose 6-dehydrogenase